MAQAQKSAAKTKQPAARARRRRWWPSVVAVTAMLAVAVTVGWGAYSFLQRANVEAELEEFDDFESFEPLTDTSDQARKDPDAEARATPREIEEQHASGIMPAWPGLDAENVRSTSGPPIGLTDHRSESFQAGFSPESSARTAGPAWLLGTIEVDDHFHEPTSPQREAFVQPNGPSLY